MNKQKVSFQKQKLGKNINLLHYYFVIFNIAENKKKTFHILKTHVHTHTHKINYNLWVMHDEKYDSKIVDI